MGGNNSADPKGNSGARDTLEFEQFFENELKCISNRRSRLSKEDADHADHLRELGRGEVKPFAGFSTKDPVTRPDGSPDAVYDTIGLALSGGGIRSASFCLGVLQALDLAGALRQVDYLSTVSGGGYIGASLTAAMSQNGGKFPFAAKFEKREPPSIQHLRDTSNYLFPNGPYDVLRDGAIYLRGLVTNFILVMAALLACAAFTIFINPTFGAVEKPDLLGWELQDSWNLFGLHYFVLTLYALMAVAVSAVVWGIIRSNSSDGREVGRTGVRLFSAGLLIVALIAFFELQPYVLSAIHDWSAPDAPSKFLGYFAAVMASFATVVGFLSQKLGEMVKNALQAPRLRTKIMGYLGKLVIWVAAAVVPVLLWVAYLGLSYWGIAHWDPVKTNIAIPDWLQRVIGYTDIPLSLTSWEVFILAALALFYLSSWLRPNANSLHPLYRDRLAKTFLFEPRELSPGPREDLPQLSLKLSQIKDDAGPYHLINSALNVQDSKTSNRRGRNADFFLFSRKYIGSETTGYVPTEDMEKLETELDLATAMAISGAAFSSNMGAATIKPLTPTLAILNIRTGYWLRNPRFVDKSKSNVFANFYFIGELLGLLDENKKSVYLTDGGHIDNLGLYELLRRRCHVIIAVDAEQDAQMSFNSFINLQRYARIDLGIRIELPWQTIHDTTQQAGEVLDAGQRTPHQGPHCAIGEIQYPGGQYGVLIYIKSSLTGDENDYIRHYREHYPMFPHESTLDQFFTEEQFEVYRALGFHAASGLFDRRDQFAHLDPEICPRTLDETAYLDRLFPRASALGGWPREHVTFGDALAAEVSGGQTPPPHPSNASA
jgi:Patatin-like phospholipase